MKLFGIPLFESVVKKETPQADVNVDKAVPFASEANVQELMGFIDDIRRVRLSREERFLLYEEMSNNSIIASALSLLVSHTISPFEDGDYIKIDTSLQRDKKLIEEFFNNLDYQSLAKQALRSLLVYGDVYIRVNPDLSIPYRYKYSVESPREVSQLFLDEVPVGYEYTYNKNKLKQGEPEIVHDIISNIDYLHVIHDHMNKDTVILTKDSDKRVYEVHYGTSYLEDAVEAYRILEYLESLLIVARLRNTQSFHLWTINTGGASSKESTAMLRDFKQRLNATEALDTVKHNYLNTRKPIPLGGNLYCTTKNEKGTVQHELIEGPNSLGELYDINYYQNKLFAALKIPKAFLGYDETLSGGIGNESLTLLDENFCRLIKSLREEILQVTKLLINSYFISINQEIPDFSVYMAPLLTPESSAETRMYQEKLSVFRDAYETLSPLFNNAQEELAYHLITNVLKDESLAHLYDEMLENSPAKEVPNESE